MNSNYQNIVTSRLLIVERILGIKVHQNKSKTRTPEIGVNCEVNTHAKSMFNLY